jgi:hypothetical protein
MTPREDAENELRAYFKGMVIEEHLINWCLGWLDRTVKAELAAQREWNAEIVEAHYWDSLEGTKHGESLARMIRTQDSPDG